MLVFSYYPLTDIEQCNNPLGLGILWGLRVTGVGVYSHFIFQALGFGIRWTQLRLGAIYTALQLTHRLLRVPKWRSLTTGTGNVKQEREKKQKRKEEEREMRVSRIITGFDFIDVDGSDIPFGAFTAFYGFLLLLLNVLVRCSLICALHCVVVDMCLLTIGLTL